MSPQRTLRRTVPCAGIGLHSGQKVTLSLKPAPANYGIRFRRADLGGLEIPASVSYLGGAQQLQTGLVADNAAVETVEHLLAALRGLGIDNACVELNQPEVPIMDGSAAPWVYLIQDAGVKELGAARRTLQVLRHQSRTLRITEESFVDEIAPARTFTFLKDVEMMRQNGLALGGSLENAIVLGETGILNNALRFEDEFVRHKILDAVGDLALVGYPVIGHLVAHRAGHALHTEFAAKILEETTAWRLVEAPVDVPALPLSATVKAAAPRLAN